MKLTILGGSAASPNTGMGCSGYLVESEGSRILIDPGPGTFPELRRHTDFRLLDGVIVSHMHLDHCLDLLALRHALAYNPIPAPKPVPVWLPPGGAAFLARATAPFDECDDPGRFDATVDVHEYDPELALVFGELNVTFAPTVHYLPTWAMRFEAKGGPTLGYTADTGPTANLASFFLRVGLLLAEITLLDLVIGLPESRGSLTASEAGLLASAAEADQLVLTHYWEEHDTNSQLAAAASTYVGPVTLAKPGLTVNW